jgi:transposase
MPKPYSEEFRIRVIEDVVTGASRREAAEHYGISPSVVVIWAQRFAETGNVAAKPSGGSPPRWRSTRDFCWRWLPSSRT